MAQRSQFHSEFISVKRLDEVFCIRISLAVFLFGGGRFRVVNFLKVDDSTYAVASVLAREDALLIEKHSVMAPGIKSVGKK